MVLKVRERKAVSKQEAQKFDVEIFNLRKLSELEVREQCQIKISNMCGDTHIASVLCSLFSPP